MKMVVIEFAEDGRAALAEVGNLRSFGLQSSTVTMISWLSGLHRLHINEESPQSVGGLETPETMSNTEIHRIPHLQSSFRHSVTRADADMAVSPYSGALRE